MKKRTYMLTMSLMIVVIAVLVTSFNKFGRAIKHLGETHTQQTRENCNARMYVKIQFGISKRNKDQNQEQNDATTRRVSRGTIL